MAWKYDDDTKTIAGLPSSVEAAKQVIERQKRQQRPDWKDIDPPDQFDADGAIQATIQMTRDEKEDIRLDMAQSVLDLATNLNQLTKAVQDQNDIIMQLAKHIKENRTEIGAHTQILVDLFDTSPEIGRRIRFAQELREQGDELAKEED